MKSRRRFKQNLSLQDRLIAWSKEVREQAALLPPGPDRDVMLKRASQADTSAARRSKFIRNEKPLPHPLLTSI
jgi:hypothetical protein